MYNNTHRKSLKPSAYRKAAISQNTPGKQKVSWEVLNKDKIRRMQQSPFTSFGLRREEVTPKLAPSWRQVTPKLAPSWTEEMGCTPDSTMDAEKIEKKRQKSI